MSAPRIVKVSKYLSKHLRHNPQSLGLTLEPGGWVFVEDLLFAAKSNGFRIDRDELLKVVEENDKQRFSIDETGEKIRANQGHSVQVDLQLEPKVPPKFLYHGTGLKFVDAILADGLKRMKRHHVHLSRDLTTAVETGKRKGEPVVLKVDTAKMHSDGFVFYCTANQVWLTDHVPATYLEITPHD